MRPTTSVRRAPLRRLATAAAAALLLALAACGSAETAALDAQDDPTSEATSEPTEDEPTEDDPTEDEPTEDEPTTEEPTTPPTTAPPTPQTAAPRATQCRNLNSLDVRARIATLAAAPVPCGASHNAQTYKVGALSAAQKTAIAGGNRLQIFAATRRSCELDLPAWLGVADERQKQSQFDFVVGVPTASDVAAGATWLRCDVVLRNGSTKAEPVPTVTRGALAGRKGDGYLMCIRSSNLSFASGTFLCRDPHNWRSVKAIKLGTGSKPFPGTSQVTRTLRSRCSTEVRRYLDTSGSFQYGWLPPSADQWKYGDRWGVCFAKTRR